MYIYLDQNKWVDLGRAIIGRDDGKKYIDAYDKIKEKIKNDEWILPFSIIHLMETLDIGDEERKKRFSSILIDISKMNTMCSYRKIEKYEFLNSILKILGKPEIDINEYLFSKNIFHLMDLSVTDISVVAKNDKIKAEVEKFLQSTQKKPEMLYFLINLIEYKELKQSNYTEWELAAIEQEQIKNDLFSKIKDDTMRFRIILAGKYIYKRDVYFNYIFNYLKNQGLEEKDIKKIENYVQNHFEDYLTTIPSLYVSAKLTFQRYKNQSKAFHRNDIKDIVFLSTAIPYCDVIITERSWADYIKRENLDQKYNVKIFTDLNELLSL